MQTRFLTILITLAVLLTPLITIAQSDDDYSPRGIGGGGAMLGFSISPFDENFWLVGTDMGTLFKSENGGLNWQAISHSEVRYSADVENSVNIGFSADNTTIFHSYAGCYPKRSLDRGKTWSIMPSLRNLLPTGGYNDYDCWITTNQNRIKYWISDTENKNIIYAASGDGLYRTSDNGETWLKTPNVSGKSVGTFIDHSTNPATVYHASDSTIYLSTDNGVSFQSILNRPIVSFSGGRDENGLTLAFIEQDTTPCTEKGISSSNEHCGFVWIKNNEDNFVKTKQIGGDFIKMAENNSQVIYVTGSSEWSKEPGIGTSVWKSADGGTTWKQTFQQYIDREPYSWPEDLFEKSAVAYDVGLHDAGYHSFTVNQLNANMVGGTENYFLHVSKDQGVHWKSPFTAFVDNEPRKEDKKWKSIGLEVTSTHQLKFHPKNQRIGYAAYSDIGGLATEDGGKTWRITRLMNTIYDHAFIPTDDQVVFAAMSTFHDWPHGGYKNIALNPEGSRDYYDGGIFKSYDRGINWERLTPDNFEWGVPFLSVEYDSVNQVLYAGTQGRGIARSTDEGETWHWFNKGLPNSEKIIGQIEIDPENQDIYLMLSGDAPHYTNHESTGIYYLKNGSEEWELLRGIVHEPYASDLSWKGQLWHYPVHFAVDWSDKDRNTMWLTDVRVPTLYLAEGIWKTEDRGKNWYQKYTTPNPGQILIHPKNNKVVYINGIIDQPALGDKPDSGAIYTEDGGLTWKKNFNIPAHHILSSITIDPDDINQVFYTTFGAGMFYGPNPVQTDTEIKTSEEKDSEENDFNTTAENTTPASNNHLPLNTSNGGGGYRTIINSQDIENTTSKLPEEEITEKAIKINYEGENQDVSKSTESCRSPFEDTQLHWAQYYIEKLYCLKIVSGKSSTKFKPDNTLKRSEAVKVILLSLNHPVGDKLNLNFNDLSKKHWSYPYVQAAMEMEWIEGYYDNTFRPDRAISRAEFLKILLSASEFEPVNEKTIFSDVEQELWYSKWISSAYREKIIKGYEDRTFKPHQPITRAEAAKIIYLNSLKY